MSDIPFHHWLSRRRGFLERTIADLELILDRSHATDAITSDDGFLNRLDARVKLFVAIVLAIQAASSHSPWHIGAIVTLGALLAIASRLPMRPLFRLWLSVGVLAAMLAIPAMFLTDGKLVFWRISDNGALVATKLVLRALASSTLAAVLVLSTP